MKVHVQFQGINPWNTSRHVFDSYDAFMRRMSDYHSFDWTKHYIGIAIAFEDEPLLPERRCESLTCLKIYRPNNPEQRYCCKPCKVAEKARRQKRRRNQRGVR